MATIRDEIAAGKFVWSRDLEDVHLNVERRLTTLIGDAGKRLHTGRSRNDQVATDMRLWLRGAIDAIAVGACATAPRIHRPGREACRNDPAGLYAFAGRATGHLRSSPHGLRSHVRARQRAAGRLPQASQSTAARKRRAGGHVLSHRSRAGRTRSRVRGHLHQLARRRRRSRFRHRVRRRSLAHHGAPVAPGRGVGALVESALRLS